MINVPSKECQTPTRLRRAGIVTGLIIGAALLPRGARAQSFSSGSTGADGALDFSGAPSGSVIDFRPDMVTPALDPERDNVYHFTTITIPAGVTVRLTARYLSGPVYWLASGDVQIAGILDLNGQSGQVDRVPSLPGAGGFPGGIVGGGDPNSPPPQRGSGPGGGQKFHCYNCSFSGDPRGSFTGNVFLVPLIGGSGGGGGDGGNGGAGGGALLIASSSTINITGTIRANGGAPTVDGGGASGGAVRLAAVKISGGGTLQALGANGAGNGRIRLEAFQQLFTGGTNPAALLRTPYKTFVPNGPPPSVRVVTVGGVPVASTPLGTFDLPDVTISTLATTPIVIETHSIPPGTVVNLHLSSQDGSDVQIDTTPLVGTTAQATASAGLAIPTGFSRIFVRATWTNQ